MKSNFKVRLAATIDVDFFYQCICELQNEIFDYNIFKEIFIDNLYNFNHLYLILENELEGIGIITLHQQKLLHHCGVVSEIQEFFIVPKYRGQGFGDYLITIVKDYCKLNKIKSLEVTSNKKRVENVAIYEKLGFELSHNKFTIKL
jgi:PhnO protein